MVPRTFQQTNNNSGAAGEELRESTRKKELFGGTHPETRKTDAIPPTRENPGRHGTIWSEEAFSVSAGGRQPLAQSRGSSKWSRKHGKRRTEIPPFENFFLAPRRRSGIWRNYRFVGDIGDDKNRTGQRLKPIFHSSPLIPCSLHLTSFATIATLTQPLSSLFPPDGLLAPL